jgi:hypothetical protein
MAVTLRHSKGERKGPHSCFECLSMTAPFSSIKQTLIPVNKLWARQIQAQLFIELL